MQERITDTRIGILGGGQLGRMIIQSAVDFNLNISILDPDPEAPCKNLTANFVPGSLTDFETVYKFGSNCDLITIEIENVNVEALRRLQQEGKKVYPQPEIIELIQDKVEQKLFYKNNEIPTSDFIAVENAEDVSKHHDRIPFVNKLAKEGYDGRGVQIIRNEADLSKAFDKRGLAEEFVDFEKEISVIVARNESGEIVFEATTDLSSISIPIKKLKGSGDYLISIWDDIQKKLLPSQLVEVDY